MFLHASHILTPTFLALLLPHVLYCTYSKELVLQVRKVIGLFASPKKIFIVSDLPKTRSGKASSGLCLPQHSFTD
jgi:hypothetical protein